MACGRPVIAYGQGGALHTVVAGKTGEFIDEQTPEAIVSAVEAFDPSAYDVVVTGEGAVDATTVRGKAPAEIARRCRAAGVRCVVFGGVVAEPIEGVETIALSGEPARARADLVELGRRLGGSQRR